MTKLLIFILNIYCINLIAAEFPSYISKCGRRDPNFQQCVIKSVKELYPRLMKGIPELDIPAIEPFKIPNPISLGNGNDFSVNVTNLKIYGLNPDHIQHIEADFENKKIKAQIYFDKVRVAGDYEVFAKIVVQIARRGYIELDILGLELNVGASFVLRKKKHGEYMYFTSITSKLTFKDIVTNYLSNGSQEVDPNDPITITLHTGRREIAESLMPSLEKTFSTEALRIANSIVKKATYDEFLPNTE